MRILIIRLSAIGDCIHAVPVVNALRAQLPDAELGWAIQALPHTLLEGLPAVDRFHIYPRRARGALGHARELASFRRELRQTGYDVALDIQGLTKSGLVAWMSGAPLRIGFGGAESRELNRLLINRRVEPDGAHQHVVDRNLGLLRALDLQVPARVDWALPTPGRSQRIDRFKNDQLDRRPYLVINPGTTWETKRWPVASFGELAAMLAQQTGNAVVVTWGDPGEERDAEWIVEHCQNSSVVKAPATGLRELHELIAGARLLVGNDTGPMHLADALGVPVVALFGASDPLRNGPYSARNRSGEREASSSTQSTAIVLSAQRELDCRPCWKSRCARLDLACLRELPAATVAAACFELLAEPARESR